MNINELASKIDHTLLKPNATRDQFIQLCVEAKQHQFASVCVAPNWIKTCKEELLGSQVPICTVIGFPLGSHTIESKVFEMKNALELGAQEIDYVLNLGFLKSGKWDEIEKEMLALRGVDKNITIKVILETGYLNNSEIMQCTRLAEKSKLDFVKTSTGFGPRGASLNDITLMKDASESIKTKASGGIRSLKDALSYIDKGVDRIGTSSGVQILGEIE